MSSALLVAVIISAWIGVGPFLAWFMRRRGYDSLSWLAVGSIIGPSALAIAFMERVRGIPTDPEVVVRGSGGKGPIHVLLSLDHGEDVVTLAQPLIDMFDGCLGRVSLVRVVREGGPIADQDLARATLKRESLRLEGVGPDAVLLFGLTAEKVSEMAVSDGFTIVLTEHCDQRLASLLPRDVVYLGSTTKAMKTITSKLPMVDRQPENEDLVASAT